MAGVSVQVPGVVEGDEFALDHELFQILPDRPFIREGEDRGSCEMAFEGGDELSGVGRCCMLVDGRKLFFLDLLDLVVLAG